MLFSMLLSMLLNARLVLLAVLASTLVGCVSVPDRMQLVSNTHAANRAAYQSASSEAQSCDQVTVKTQQPKNLHGLNPHSISFLNWNIYKGNGENWQQDLSVYAQNHDVMTIQEATQDEAFTGLLERHDFNWVMNTAFYLNGTAAGVMTVANVDAVHSCGFKVTEPLIRIPKSALVSYYTINGADEKLLVANIHSINFTFGVTTYREQLDKLYNAIRHHNGPMIVAGDFNSWSDERMREVVELTGKLLLSKIEYPVNNKTHVFGNAIDHVFYRKLELVSNRVWQVTSSDHNPISVNFRLKGSDRLATTF